MNKSEYMKFMETEVRDSEYLQQLMEHVIKIQLSFNPHDIRQSSTTFRKYKIMWGEILRLASEKSNYLEELK